MCWEVCGDMIHFCEFICLSFLVSLLNENGL